MAKRAIILLGSFIFALLIGQIGAPAYQSDNVKDYMNFLTEEEVELVQGLIEKTVLEHNLDLVIVITDDTQGKSSRDFADDYYDLNGFGVGNDYSGILMLVNMEERELWISTTGRAIDIFTDDRISNVTTAVANLLTEGNYYEASEKFVNEVAYYAGRGVPQGQYRIDPAIEREYIAGNYRDGETANTYTSRVLRQMKSLPVYVAALIIAMIATIIASLPSKGKVTINNQTYEEQGSFVLSNTSDDYIRESTTRVKIATRSGPSGGIGSGSGGMRSSTHRSSSGRSHGGGGRKF